VRSHNRTFEKCDKKCDRTVALLKSETKSAIAVQSHNRTFGKCDKKCDRTIALLKSATKSATKSAIAQSHF